MADDDEASEEPAVELGDGTPVEGQPLARVASRLTWPHEKSRVIEKEGDSVIRTPDGPQQLSDVLEGVDVTYFDSRQSFERAITDAVGDAPVRAE